MTLNETLLETARTAGRALIDAEHQLLTTRADYHAAVRRLHLAGGSLREIADALGLSHQRVQQIVDRSGGSWWRRAWRTRNTTRDAICTWCDRPPGEVDKLVAGPNVYICDRCAREMERALNDAPATRGAGKCSFCGKRAAGARRMAATPAAAVCSECLTLCRDFMKLDA
jgi:hypothetical protein